MSGIRLQTNLEDRVLSGEQRRSQRRERVLLSGKIVFDDCARTIDCTIRDRATLGANVRLASAIALPESVYLIDIKNGLVFDATVTWTRAKDLGLNFTTSHRLDVEEVSAGLRSLRQIWVELAVR